MVDVLALAQHGIVVTTRASTPQEAAMIGHKINYDRAETRRRLIAAGNRPLLGVALLSIVELLVIIVGSWAFSSPGALVAGVGMVAVSCGLGSRAVFAAKRASQQAILAHEAELATQAGQAVAEWTFRPKRVLSATDPEGDVNWVLFEVDGGFLARLDAYPYGTELLGVEWREAVTLVSDTDGGVLRVMTEGSPVPVYDGTAERPGVSPDDESSSWSPGTESRLINEVLPAKHIWAGDWPDEARNLPVFRA